MKLLLLALPAFAQQLNNTGPINATPNGATVQQQFTAGANAVAALQFEVPAGVAMPVSGTLGTKTLACYAPTRRCIVYGLDDNVIPTSILSTFLVTASGSYGLVNVLGATPAGNDAAVSTGAALVVTLPFSRCDVNHDGAYSQADQDLLAQYLLNPASIPAGVATDINKNGSFNNGDVQFEGRVIRGQVACPE